MMKRIVLRSPDVDLPVYSLNVDLVIRCKDLPDPILFPITVKSYHELEELISSEVTFIPKESLDEQLPIENLPLVDNKDGMPIISEKTPMELEVRRRMDHLCSSCGYDFHYLKCLDSCPFPFVARDYISLVRGDESCLPRLYSTLFHS